MNQGKFLLVKGRAGLGNRILCALTGILYARLTRRRLLVDWSDDIYSNDGSNVFHRFFQCSLGSSNEEIPATDSVIPSIWRGHLHESSRALERRYGDTDNPQGWKKFSIDLTTLYYQEDILVMWTLDQKVDLLRSHFKGTFKEFAQASTEAILSKLLREDLILHPQIRERVDQFKGNNFSKTTVGIHVRYTDHRVRLWAVLKKLNTLLKREPELQIFLSTDNIQIKNLFEESYPGVITTLHWYPKPGLRLHGYRKCPDLIESGIEALIDLYLLAECYYLIIDSSSSFSYIAKLLAKTPASHIFAVGRQRKLPPRLRRFLWHLMLRLRLFSWGLNIVRAYAMIRKLFSKYKKRAERSFSR